MPQVRQSLPPHQLGVGVSNGAESLVHSVKLLLSNPSVPLSACCCLLLDFSNAFNCVDRSILFRDVRSRFPALSRWLEYCYGTPSNLLFGDFSILSCSGVQQGDPLGPLAFSTLLQPIIEQIQRDVPGLCLNGWYLDDGILSGSFEDLQSALHIIENLGPPRGLHLNRSKCLLFVPPELGSPPSSFPASTSRGFELLGSPVGPPDFCRASVAKRLDKVKDSVQSLALLQDSQMEYSLLKSCLGLQKISCALRTTPPDILLPVIHSFDEFMFHCINDLVGGALSLWSHLKATLPPRLGGIGIRLASAHSGAIFLASVQACSALVLSLSDQVIPLSYVSSAIASFTSFTGLSNVTSLSDLPQPVTQKSLSRLVDDFAFNHLLHTSSEVRSRAVHQYPSCWWVAQRHSFLQLRAPLPGLRIPPLPSILARSSPLQWFGGVPGLLSSI